MAQVMLKCTFTAQALLHLLQRIFVVQALLQIIFLSPSFVATHFRGPSPVTKHFRSLNRAAKHLRCPSPARPVTKHFRCPNLVTQHFYAISKQFHGLSHVANHFLCPSLATPFCCPSYYKSLSWPKPCYKAFSFLLSLALNLAIWFCYNSFSSYLCSRAKFGHLALLQLVFVPFRF